MTLRTDRKQLGAYYTPDDLVRAVVGAVITPDFVARHDVIRVLDPACGDGRFLVAVADRVRSFGGVVELHGVDIDRSAVDEARQGVPDAQIELADSLGRAWDPASFQLVIGNPPFLSQLADATTRGGSSRYGGGPYADVAVEFLALAASVVEPDGGRVAFVLPQSLLASRDAAAIRRRIDDRASMIWSRWSSERVFDAQIHTCALVFEFGATGDASSWSRVVTERLGIPDLPSSMSTDGRLGDRATLNANFRDEYYGLVPAVADHAGGPPLITSGLIDPGRSWWGSRPITFARHTWERPRVDLELLDPRMQEWARRRLVPKVLVANQTQIIEAVCDPRGELLPAVPVIGVYPNGAHWDDEVVIAPGVLADSAWAIAAVLTSGVASAWLWHRSGGTGLSAASVRLSPTVLSELPWPAGDLAEAVTALERSDLRGCARAIDHAYGAGADMADVANWWDRLLERIEARQPTVG